MSPDTYSRLEAAGTISGFRARGACLLIVYKPNLTDRYLRTVPKTVAIPQWLRDRLMLQADDIAAILKEEATMEDYQ